jgi:hypothetical protein
MKFIIKCVQSSDYMQKRQGILALKEIQSNITGLPILCRGKQIDRVKIQDSEGAGTLPRIN